MYMYMQLHFFCIYLVVKFLLWDDFLWQQSSPKKIPLRHRIWPFFGQLLRFQAAFAKASTATSFWVKILKFFVASGTELSESQPVSREIQTNWRLMHGYLMNKNAIYLTLIDIYIYDIYILCDLHPFQCTIFNIHYAFSGSSISRVTFWENIYI